MDPKLTIVIPYHAEEATMHFVKQQLNYYHFNITPMVVVLAVSGDNILKLELEQFIKKFNEPRFVIFKAEESNITNVVSFAKKIHDALKLVTTPYVAINGADDVIIPEAADKGTEVLAHNLDIAAVKGYTVVCYFNSGNFLSFDDLGIMNNLPIKRLKLALKDRDSIFYILRRTKDLVAEYENIVSLSKKSKIVANSFYHIEHFMALSLASLGKIYVFDSPWRLQGSHNNNHSSHTPASFLRVQLGVLDKANYEWFRSVTKNMDDLSYNYYKFLWVCSQIRGISITFKQIVYNFIHKKCSFMDSIRLFTYLILNKVYIFSQKGLPKKWFGERVEDFVKTEQYLSLKKHYFSEKDIELIESNNVSS